MPCLAQVESPLVTLGGTIPIQQQDRVFRGFCRQVGNRCERVGILGAKEASDNLQVVFVNGIEFPELQLGQVLRCANRGNFSDNGPSGFGLKSGKLAPLLVFLFY